MAYSDFTFAKLKQKYGIDQNDIILFEPVKFDLIAPSKRLSEDIDDKRLMPLYTGKAQSEILIYPIFRELKKRNKHISIFSGYTFNIETEQELSGEPDFLITSKQNIIEPQRPIFCLVNQFPEDGFAQCAAEMYAARLFNQQNNEPFEIIYGAVTNGYDWSFLKLEGNTVYVDIDRYFINELPKLLGILQFIVDQSKPKSD